MTVKHPWIETHRGRQFNFSDHMPFDLEDIAHALANLCRYNGHTHTFYSVAEHCVLVAQWVRDHTVQPSDRELRAALMHDAAEAYLGDIPSPLKTLLPDFKALERQVDAAVATRFDFDYPFPPIVKYADLHVLVDERRQALYHTPHRWDTDDLEPLGVTLQFWQPPRAKGEFLLLAAERGIR